MDFVIRSYKGLIVFVSSPDLLELQLQIKVQEISGIGDVAKCGFDDYQEAAKSRCVAEFMGILYGDYDAD